MGKIGRPRRFTPQQVAEALRYSAGIIAGAAKLLHADRGTIASMLDQHPELRAAQVAARETTLDLVESKIVAAAGRGEPWALRFYAERMGRHRGWGLAAAHISTERGITVVLAGDLANV